MSEVANANLILLALGSVFTFLSTAAYLGWWLNKQFAVLRSLIYERIEISMNTILAKLEYHEKHDDSRFAEIRNSIMEIRLRNAAIDGIIPPRHLEENQ